MQVVRLFFLTISLLLIGFAHITQEASAEENVRILVKYKNNEIVTLSKNNKVAKKIEVVQTTKDKVKTKIKELEQNSQVEYAEIDQKVYTQGYTPNDPNYSLQKTVFDVLDVSEAWGNYKPTTEIVVAVIDSGVDLDHPDLTDALVEGENVIKPERLPEDTNGHGTHIAGLVGASTNNGIGISSISKDVKIMPVKVLEGETGYMSDVIKGIYFAVDNGANILNLSLGSYTNMQGLKDAIDYAESKNVLIVAAAGNDGLNRVMYPAAYEEVIAVGSVITETLGRATFSNYGSYVDVYVPGTSIYSTFLDNRYATMDGTSMSTGIVSSVAAMIKQQAPFLQPAQIQKIIGESLHSKTPGQEGIVNAAKVLELIETYQRLSGATSVETAIEISKEGWQSLQEKSLSVKGKQLKGSFVVLATADTYPDSLVASPLASYLDSPILLVKNQKITEEIISEITRLRPTYTVIVGGKNAVSSESEATLSQLGTQTVRLSGKTRYETAIAVNEVIPYTTNKTFIVSGENYPDALSIAPYSGHLQYPLLFTRSTALPTEVVSYLKEKAITKSYIVGGSAVISKTVENQLPSPFRLSGVDRFATNNVVQKTFGQTTSEVPLFYATGFNYPDALAVGPLAARTGSPVILVNKTDSLILKDSTELFSSKNYYILGGNGAIPFQKAWEIDVYVNN
ncbi:S8 family serine peptidase [Bacillus coreaensis]